jgi:Tol biopolymer transport system component
MRLRTTLLGAPLALLALAVPPAHATFPGANGRIAFSSNRSGDVEVYSMNPDGSDLQRLTNAPGEDSAVRWSADGRRLAFVSHRDGQSEIYTMNSDGSDQTRLTSNSAEDVFPAWSPDGSKITFASNRADASAYEIYAMNADGSGVTRLTTTPPVGGTQVGFSDFPLWSSDDRISFSSIRNGLQTLQLFTMAPDGSNQKQVTNDAVGALYSNWSPDNSRLLYYSERTFDTGGENGDVFVVNADGTGTKQLTNTPGADLAASWSPDGTKILFATDRDGQLELYTMDADGSNQARLTTDPSGDAGADWAPVPLPAPKLGETVNATVLSGTVLVKTRGSSKFSTLAQARQIKVGSQLDTRKGVVQLATAAGKGKTQRGAFGRGVFQVAQSKAAKGLTDLELKGGSFGSCKASGARAAAKKKKAVRSLFSKAKGKFRTKGRYSAATVRGTTWLVTDRCDGTLTSVTSGTVEVRDFKRKKTVKVKAGKSYLARAR